MTTLREKLIRRSQTKSNWYLKTVMPLPSGRKLPPLGYSYSAVELGCFPAVMMTFLIEMVVDRSVDRREFLKWGRSPEFRHRLLPSPARLV